MKLSNNGQYFIKNYEGYREKAYKCSSGVWTIGWGTTQYPNGLAVKSGDTCTKEQAQQYFDFNITKYIDAVNYYIDKSSEYINQNIFDALVSFSYNLGAYALNASFGPNQIAELSNKGNYEEATRQMKLFNKSGGQVNQGLVNRRQAEVDLYLTPIKEIETKSEKYYANVITDISTRFGLEKYLVKFINVAGVYTDENLTKKDNASDFKIDQTQLSWPIGWRGVYFVHAFMSNNGKIYYFAYKRKFN